MGYNEFWIGNKKIFSLVDDTVLPQYVLNGYTFHDADGNSRAGTCKFDTQTNLVNINSVQGTNYRPVQSAMMEKGGQAPIVGFVNGNMITGGLENKGQVVVTVDNKSFSIVFPSKCIIEGLDVHLDSTNTDTGEDTLIADYIKAGINILGVTGTFTGFENYYIATPTVNAKLADQNLSAAQFEGKNAAGETGTANSMSSIVVKGVVVQRFSNGSNVDGASGDGYGIKISPNESYTLPWTE